jgi:hypothetical protein
MIQDVALDKGFVYVTKSSSNSSSICKYWA